MDKLFLLLLDLAQHKTMEISCTKYRKIPNIHSGRPARFAGGGGGGEGSSGITVRQNTQNSFQYAQK